MNKILITLTFLVLIFFIVCESPATPFGYIFFSRVFTSSVLTHNIHAYIKTGKTLYHKRYNSN
jgi:hypothetical protein